MINNSDKKALSTVVTTLIIILLVFVAIGIVWVVVRNVVEGGAGNIDINAKCLASSVKAVSVDTTSCNTNTCTLSLKRDLGDDAIGGVKLVFINSTGDSSDVVDSPGDIATLATVSRTVSINGLTDNPDKVEVTVYFKDDSGNEKLCGTTSSYSF